MEKEAGMVVQEGKEKTLPYLAVHDHRRTVHTVGLPEIIGQFGLIPSEIGFDPLRLVEASSLEEPIETLDRGVKVRSQKLTFPCHPHNHRQGSSLELRLKGDQNLLRFFIQRSSFPFVRTGLGF